MSEIQYKVCTRCKSSYPATTEYFAPSKLGKYGLRGDCRECQRAQDRVDYQRRKEEIRARKRAAYAANPEYDKARGRKYREENPHVLAEWLERTKAERAQKAAKYYLEHKEKYRERELRYRLEKPESDKIRRQRYILKNNAKFKANNRRAAMKRRAIMRGLPDDWTTKDEIFALEYFSNSCAFCGISLGLNVELNWEHYIAVTSPDCIGNVPHNIVPSCKACNLRKTTKTAEQWIVERFGEKHGVEIIKRIQEYFDIVRR